LRNPKFQVDAKTKEYCLVDLAESTHNPLTLSGVRSVKDRVRLPTFYVELEEVLAYIRQGDWEHVAFEHDFIKDKLRKIWAYAFEDRLLQFERQVYEVMLDHGNGGLSVDTIIERLTQVGILKTFSQVRDALEHLCTLFVVERQSGMFSVRYGVLE
jgi:hypothetical protein